MKVAITGANGVVGRALQSTLDPSKFEIIALDLPDNDVTNLEQLTNATVGCDAIIHMAWNALRDNFKSGTIDPDNDLMIFNVYQAAVMNNIPKVIMGSSNHAHRHDIRDKDGKIRATTTPAIPDSPYGAEKIFMEALGRYFSKQHDLCVVCIRIGNVNADDKPQPSTPEDPLRYLSYADLSRLVTCILEAEKIPENFEIVYGVSNQEVFDWSNSFGYVPED